MAIDEVGPIDLSAVCNYSELLAAEDENRLDPTLDDFEVFVYRPTTGGAGAWPEEPPRPVVFFVPGAGQNLVGVPPGPADHHYAHIFEPLVEAGFVVIAGEPIDDQTGPGTEWSSGERQSMLGCMMLWANDEGSSGWEHAGSGKTSLDVVLAGHSRGGGATSLLIQNFPSFQGIMPMEDYQLCAAVEVAPRWSNNQTQDPTNTDVTIQDDRLPPFLAIQGAIDEDTVGQAISAFDRMRPDDEIAFGDPTTMSLVDKMLVWIYGGTHNSFGGRPNVAQYLQGRTTGPYYIERFLRWQLFGESSARDALMLLMDPQATSSDFDSLIADSDLWSDIEPQYSQLGRPLVLGSYAQGVGDDGARRFVVDTLARGSTLAECNGPIGDSTAGLGVDYTGLDPLVVCQGPAQELTSEPPLSWDRHQTEALRVDWGDIYPEGVLEWALVDEDGNPFADLSSYSYINLRIANLVESEGVFELSCNPADPDVFELEVELVSETPSGEEATAVQLTGANIQQQIEWVDDAAEQCSASQFMHQVRIPLRSFCENDDGDLATNALTAIRVRFPESNDPHRSMIDGIEFTHDPLDPNDAACGKSSKAFRCEISGSFAATEHSCKVEPGGGGSCSSQETQSVSAPWVGIWQGWIVNAPPGWITGSPPTSQELTAIKGLCSEACELEWVDNNDVTHNCDQGSSFLTPVALVTPRIESQHRIPDAKRDGSGIFGAQTLSCDLEDDCCEDAFDEDLCATRALRATLADMPLERGEERRVSLGGASSLTLITPSDSETVSVTGVAGYSECIASSSTCPFYLGSLELGTSAAVTVSDTCPDSSPFQATLSDVDVQLVQPAFGIADGTSTSVGFPVQGLHLRVTASIGGVPYTLRMVNEETVVMAASASGLTASDVDVDFEVPCGDSVMPVTARIDLATTAVDDAPPSATINIAALVNCPSSVSFSATVTDPDGDLASTRWLVDDVLMKPGSTSMTMTTNHVFTLVARDARGGTTTKTKSVSCR